MSADVGAEARRRRARRTAWALTDAAREPFLTIVLSLVFPPYFVAQIAGDPVRGTTLWGYGLSAAALALVVLAPLAGALADRSTHRLRWTAGCVGAAAAALLALWPVTAAEATPVAVLSLVAVAYVGIELSRVFTDGRLPQLAGAGGVGALSGIGVGLGFAAALGYLAAIALATELTRGTTDAGTVERAASAATGFWLLLLFLPFLLAFRAPRDAAAAGRGDATARGEGGIAATWAAALGGWRSAVALLRDDPQLRRYLLARIAYWDGTMALFSFLTILASTQLAWTTDRLATFGMLGLVAGAAAGLAAGALERALGARGSVLLGVGLLLGCTLALAALASAAAGPAREPAFLAVGVLASACLGQIMASSRSLLARLAPAARGGEYFGLYVTVGRAASFASPLLVALATALTGSPRHGVFGVAIVLLAAGLALVLRVRRC